MNRTVLITGCSTGIGRALAQAFNKKGDTVIATARRLESLDELKAQGCETESLDVTNADSIDQLVKHIEARHGHIDILINNAGIATMGPMAEIPADKLRQQFETNVIAPTVMVQQCLPLLRQSQQAMIINIGSISGVLTTPFAGPYCASKAAIHSISEAMRLELAPFGIRVVTVQPGGIQSNFGENASADVAEWLDENSLYAPIRNGIMARANASQDKATPAEEFARTLVQSVEKDSSSTWNIGHGSRLYPFIARWLPQATRTRVMSRKFSLAKL